MGEGVELAWVCTIHSLGHLFQGISKDSQENKIGNVAFIDLVRVLKNVFPSMLDL